MGGLFYTGQSRRTSGSFTVTCSGAKDIVKRLNKLENGGQTAIKKTVNDFMSRVVLCQDLVQVKMRKFSPF